MASEKPGHQDADLVIRLYDLRREAVMRASRDAINARFFPGNHEEFLAVTRPEHPHNAAFRQVSTYWEMVYGMAKHGVVHTEFLLDSNAEGLLLFSRVEPHLGAIRAASSPRAFQKAEWMASSCDLAKAIMTTFRARVQKKLAGK